MLPTLCLVTEGSVRSLIVAGPGLPSWKTHISCVILGPVERSKAMSISWVVNSNKMDLYEKGRQLFPSVVVTWCNWAFSLCLPEQSDEHRRCQGETPGEGTSSFVWVCCCSSAISKQNTTNKKIMDCIPWCKCLPYVFISCCWRVREPEWWLNEALVNLYQSISLLLCLTDDTRGNSRLFPPEHQAGKLSGGHRQTCKWALVIYKWH